MPPDVAALDLSQRQRLLEGWLPLAQEANLRYGWGLEAAALETLILSAAPALGSARSALEACAILWANHTRAQRQRSRGL